MLLDIFFPKTCLSCGSWGKYICLQCEKNFEYISQDFCPYCSKIHILGETHVGCIRPFEIDGALSVLYYNNTFKKIIKKIKYRLVYDSFKTLFTTFNKSILYKYSLFKEKHPNFVLQPIPLHKNRYRTRGFNQSEIIATFFNTLLGTEIIDGLVRVKDTPPQARTISKVHRYHNMRNAFRVRDKKIVENRNIILIDDVMTTGSTTKEAARVLKLSGARKIWVFTLAHG